jgi:DNA-binding response OmpR family regulator
LAARSSWRQRFSFWAEAKRLLRFALEDEDYRVHEAETGQQGLVEIANRRPSIILLDLRLPDMEGVEVLKRIREWSEAPVLVLSVRDDEARFGDLNRRNTASTFAFTSPIFARKSKQIPTKPQFIRTEPGIGYRFGSADA